MSLPWSLAVGCGDRFGEPIVAVAGPGQAGMAAGADAGGEPGGGTGTTGGSAASDAGSPAGGDDAAGPPMGPLGLCAPCTGSEACGDANDACIRHDDQLFCGRDCEEGRGCPDGYQCVQLDNSRLWQCVPENACPIPVTEPPALEELREYLLARINGERLAEGRGSLAASSCLNELAQASAVDYAHTEEPLGKFVRECDPIWPNCACGWNAEAEVAVAHWGLDWASAVEHALVNERLLTAILAYDIESLGIGFWISGDEAWIALSFH